MPKIKNNLSKIFGERLITITEVSKGTGLSRMTLTNLYYRKTKGIQFDTVEKLCDYLKVPMRELFNYIPEKEVK